VPVNVFNPKVQGMGIGLVGIGDPGVHIKRKHLWTLTAESNSTKCPFRIDPYFVKVAARPNIDFEETELNFLNGRTWIPGKPTFQETSITIMDVSGNLTGSNGSQGIYQWLTNIYNFTSPTKQYMNSVRREYTATVTLNLYDSCGTIIETWRLLDAWIKSANFGDVDTSSSDTLDIEMTLRYSQISFNHYCPTLQLQDCCTPCGSSQ